MAYMKRLARLAIAIFLVTGCTKKQEQSESVSIVGKWELIETYWSIGGPGNWHPFTSPEPVIIEFTAAENFNYTANFPKADLKLNRYTLSASNIVNMSSTNNNNTDRWYIQHIDNDRLDISIYMCFEGCAYRFSRMD
jgi:hypothetical protein